MNRLSPDARAALALVAAFLAAVAVAAPWGNHPMNDDWTHARAIADWLATGRFSYPAWLSAFMYVPILYGAALAKLFGFSFLLLRLANIFFAAGSLALFFLLLRRGGISRPTAVAATALFGANPMFFLLATTAMGDIPALFFLTVAIYCHVRAFDPAAPGSRFAWLATGCAAFALAFYTRQVVGLYLLGIIAGVVVQSRDWWIVRRRRIVVAIVAPLFLVSVLIGLAHFPLPTQIATHLIPEGWSLLRQVLLTGWQFFLLLGFFLAPLVVALQFGKIRRFLLPDALALFIVTLTAAGLGIAKGYLVGDLGNVLSPFGLGPTTEVLQGTLSSVLPIWARAVETVLCALSASAALLLSWDARRALRAAARRWSFLWIYGVLTLAVLLFVQSFDRYLLLLLPAFLAALAVVADALPWSKRIAAVGVLVLLVISVIGTHDAHAWQRARWTLGERMLARGMAADQIEGGYEWDGWHLYGRSRETLPDGYTPFWAPWWVQELFPGHPMTVILAFSELGGYHVEDRERIHGWLFPTQWIYADVIH